MFKLDLVLVLLSIGLINCEHFDHVKGGHAIKGPGFWSSYKAKVVELPSPTIEHIAPVHQRLIIEEKTHHPVQERLVVQEKVHHVEQPRVIEQVREEHHQRIVEAPRVIEKVHIEQPRIVEKVHHVAPARIIEKVHVQPARIVEKVHHVEQPRVIEQVREQVRVEHHPQVVEQVRVEEAVKGGIVTKHHQNIVLEDHHDLHHERRHEELHQQREQLNELKEIQHFQQINQHEQIRQQLEQQRHLEQAVQHKVVEVVERPAQIVEGKTNVQHIEQIIQQKQERNEKLTDAEEAVAEPFPLIPKTSFTCDDKPILPGYYSDLETGCRVYHFCFAREPKVDIVEQVHQGDHRLRLLVHHLPQPEQQQMKSFFCGQGTLFNQKLLICDHEVNVNCPESIHFYGANSEFGKPSAEPAAQLVQQKEITKTNIVQVREPVIVQQPIVQVREQIVQQPETVIVQHHDALKVVEPPRPIVQVREQIVQQPEPVKIVQRVESARIVEEPVIVQQKNDIHTTTNKLVHEDRISTSTHTDAGSFASSSELHPNWKENQSSSASRTLSESNSTSSSESRLSNESRNEAEWTSSTNTSNEKNDKLQLQNKPKNRRFLGELITTNIPNTSFTCERKPFEGFYADVEASCKIYHQCLNGRKSTYVCMRGTLFDQKTLSCNFEEKVKCSESEQYYTSNVEFN